jgi:hypothetical protein
MAQPALSYKFFFCSSVSSPVGSVPNFLAATIAKTILTESPGAIKSNGPAETNVDLLDAYLRAAGLML